MFWFLGTFDSSSFQYWYDRSPARSYIKLWRGGINFVLGAKVNQGKQMRMGGTLKNARNGGMYHSWKQNRVDRGNINILFQFLVLPNYQKRNRNYASENQSVKFLAPSVGTVHSSLN